MYNLYNKNKTDDIVGKSGEGIDFYIPIGAILVELQDCPNNLARIESNKSHIIGFHSNRRVGVYAIQVIPTLLK